MSKGIKTRIHLRWKNLNFPIQTNFMKLAIKIQLLIVFDIFLFTKIYSQDNEAWTSFKQTIDARPFSGKNFKYTAAIKANAGEGGMAMLFFEVKKKNKSNGFYDNMIDRPVNNAEWKEYSIEGKIDEDADSIQLGGLCNGNGNYYFDAFSLQIEMSTSNWQAIPLKNSGIENTNIENDLPAGWSISVNHPGLSTR